MGEVLRLHNESVGTGDTIVRGTAAGGMVRIVSCSATMTVERAHMLHGTSPVVTAALGRLLMAGLMMGQMSKVEDELITLNVRGSGPVGGLTVTANNQGQAKGFAYHPDVELPLRQDGHLDVGSAIGEGSLSVVIDRPGVAPYSSQVALVSGEIAEDLTHYFAVSDQVPSSVGVGVLVDAGGDVLCAGGFIVQLMPGHTEDVIESLEHNLSGIDSVTDLLRRGMGPADVAALVLHDLDFEKLDEVPCEFYCGCDEERALRCVAALGFAEISDMIAKGEPAEVYCHFCGTRHVLAPERLRSLIVR